MSASLSLIIMDTGSLIHRLKVKNVIRPFLDCQFKISKLDFDDQVLSWEEYGNASEEGINQLVKNHQFQFIAYQDIMRFETTVQVGWGEELLGKNDRVWISVSSDNTPYFWHVEYSEKYSNFFLNLAILLYNELLPTFGWIDFDYGSDISFEDVEKLRLITLYWATFFGKAYVKEIGEGKILNSPSWRIIPLVDGGLLYLTSPSPGLTGTHVDVEETKRYFGVHKVR